MILTSIEQSKFGSFQEILDYLNGKPKDEVSLTFARVEGDDKEDNNDNKKGDT